MSIAGAWLDGGAPRQSNRASRAGWNSARRRPRKRTRASTVTVMWRAHSPSGWRGASKSMCSLTVTTTGCVGVAVTNANAVQCGRSPRLESLWSRLQRPHSWHRTRSHHQSCRSRSGRLQRNACIRRCRLCNGRHHRHRCRRRQRYRQHCAPTRLRRPTFGPRSTRRRPVSLGQGRPFAAPIKRAHG